MILPAKRLHPAVWIVSGLLVLPAGETVPFATSPVPGGIALVALGKRSHPPRVDFHGERVLVRQDAKGYQALVGLPLTSKPGPGVLLVDGKPLTFTIRAKHYPEQRLKVDNQRHVRPIAEDEARIAREQALIAPAWKAWPDNLRAPLRFQQPTPGKAGSFGLRRFFNGEARAPHSGLDIAAPTGQAVRAPAAGVVVLTGDFFFSGNSVFLAHGEGVVTLYCHLSRIDVKEGQKVTAGELLGKVGMTGRVTGPHLHWALSLNNARVDPRLLLHQP